MSKPDFAKALRSPTGRLTESQPELQNVRPDVAVASERRFPAPNDGRHCLVCMERLYRGACWHTRADIDAWEARNPAETEARAAVPSPTEAAAAGINPTRGEDILEALRAKKRGGQSGGRENLHPVRPAALGGGVPPADPAGRAPEGAEDPVLVVQGVPAELPPRVRLRPARVAPAGAEVPAEGLEGEAPRDAGVSGDAAGAGGDESLDLGSLPQFGFLCGGAGVGKTYQARRIAALDGSEICATTGIAAMNLGQGVTTVNSLLGYFDTASLRDLWTTGKLTAKLGRLFASGCRRIVLDEVSMFPAEQLEILCAAIDELAGQNKGFQMGLTLVGDPCQLGPVKADYFFEADAFERFRAPGGITRLNKVWRQSDRDFIEALRAVRRGDRAAALDYFGDKLERTLVQEFDGTTILAKNDEVDRYNALRHARVKGAAAEWKSSRWGKERSEWKQIPPELVVKEGALVMILANQKELEVDDGTGKEYPTGRYLYVNGDLGVLRGRDEAGYAEVELQRDGEIVKVAMVTRENLVPCDSERRKELRRTAPEMLRGERQEWEALGAVSYMPLRLAFASTVHKTQGLTLDNVQLQLASHFWETDGMVYVALSRARTAAGLKIVASKELLSKRISAGTKTKEWQ